MCSTVCKPNSRHSSSFAIQLHPEQDYHSLSHHTDVVEEEILQAFKMDIGYNSSCEESGMDTGTPKKQHLEYVNMIVCYPLHNYADDASDTPSDASITHEPDFSMFIAAHVLTK